MKIKIDFFLFLFFKQINRIEAGITKTDSNELKTRIDSLLEKIQEEKRLVNRVCKSKFFGLLRIVYLMNFYFLFLYVYRQSMKYCAGQLAINYKILTGKPATKDSPEINYENSLI